MGWVPNTSVGSSSSYLITEKSIAFNFTYSTWQYLVFRYCSGSYYSILPICRKNYIICCCFFHSPSPLLQELRTASHIASSNISRPTQHHFETNCPTALVVSDQHRQLIMGKHCHNGWARKTVSSAQINPIVTFCYVSDQKK